MNYTRLVMLAILAACTLAVTPSSSLALTSAEIACRDTIAKNLASYTKVATKLAQRCHKKTPGADCNDVAGIDADGKLSSQRSSARTAIASTCSGTPSLLMQYPSCPAPAASADDAGASSDIDNYGEVADCLLALADARFGDMWSDSMGTPGGALTPEATKCQKASGKSASRLAQTIMGERRACQRNTDMSSADADYDCDGDDPRGKIEKVRSQLDKKINKACTDESAAELEACGDTVAELRTCAADSADQAGSETIRSAYELPGATATTTTILPPTTTILPPTTTLPTTTTTLPGDDCGSTFPQCNGSCPSGQSCNDNVSSCSCVVTGSGPCAPATIYRTINSRYSDPPTSTQLSAGWSGGAHVMDFPHDAGDTIDVNCNENCEDCAITFNVEPDVPTSHCRCTASPQTTCTVLNGSDPESCGSLDPTCRCYFGAPLPISSSGIPACVAIRIREQYSGTMNLRTGERWDKMSVAAVAHLGNTAIAPCPTCDGDVTPNDGVRGGTCNGGGSGSCDANGVHPTFGATSLDCLPSAATNISGGGLLIQFDLSTGSVSVPAELPCDTPVGAMCPCRVCSGNGSLGCTSNADCTEAGAGTCTVSGGAGVQPNSCDGFECGSDGFCLTGPVLTFCDGAVHPDGRGFIPCSSDLDCSPNGAGACTLVEIARCLSDPIQVQGKPDIYNPASASVFCVTGTSNPAINIGGGLPGPGTLDLDFDMDIRCQSDPSLIYEFPDGANCNDVVTTTTLPLPGCEDALSPICGGLCPVGQACTDNAGICECTGLPLPSCDDATAPLCGGLCPDTDEVCLDNGGTCECQIPTLPQCGDAAAPLCAGACPIGEICSDTAGTCGCASVGVPTCAAASAPVCGGLCDVGQVCVDSGGVCGCTIVLPPCGEATAPVCAGGCPVGSFCLDSGGMCQCSQLPVP